MDDLVWYHKPETYPIRVHLSGVLDKPKELEKLVLVLWWYSNTCVNYWYFHEANIYWFLDYSNIDLHLSLLGELKSVRL